MGKNPLANETWAPSLGGEDALEKEGTSLQCSCWEIPRTEEPGGLQCMGSQRVGHDSAQAHGPVRHTGPRGALLSHWTPGRAPLMKERERPSASTSPFPTLSPWPLPVSATRHSSCRWDRLSPPLVSLSVRLPSLIPAVRMGGCPSRLNRTPSSQAVEASCAASHPDAGHRHSGRQPDGVLGAQAPPRCHRRAAAQAVSPVKGPLADRREVPPMLTVSWTPQIGNDDRAPPVSLGAGACHPPVRTRTSGRQ